MSHFTTVETKIRNLQMLERVLEELGHNYTKADAGQTVKVKGYQGQTTDAVLVIHSSKQYEIGVTVDADTGNIGFVSDWEFLEFATGYDQQEFTSKVMQRYAYHTVKEEVAKRGYTLEEEEVDDSGHIHVTVSSWGD